MWDHRASEITENSARCLLIPPLLLVLDNFNDDINYLFTFALSLLFFFYPMMWVNNLDLILINYIPVVLITGDTATILSTLIVSILICYIIENRKNLYDIDSCGSCKYPGLISKIELVLPNIILFILVLC